jgi:hypothetical protein
MTKQLLAELFMAPSDSSRFSASLTGMALTPSELAMERLLMREPGKIAPDISDRRNAR